MKLSGVMLAATCAALGSAHAQEAAPVAAAPADGAGRDEIVVLAPYQQTRIDRRVYVVREDAEAQSTDVFEILGRVPSVSVSPEGEITLLGASGVQVQINGQPVPGQSLEQVLRGLPGVQVARIEVITNPAAQYAASASGGIINIVTRSRFASGLTGSVRAGGDTFGGSQAGVAPSWSGEKLTLSGWGGAYQGGEDRSEDGQRSFRPNGPNERKDGTNGFDYDGVYLGGSASYNPDARRRYTLAAGGGTSGYAFHERMLWTSDAAPDKRRTRASDNTTDYGYLSLERQQEGAANPLSLTKFKLEYEINATDVSNTSGERIEGAASGLRYRALQITESQRLELKLDAERPRPEDRVLTWGGSVAASQETFTNGLQLLEGAGPTPYAATLDGEDRTIAAYATYQFALGVWTLLPGVRVEDYWRAVGPGAARTEDEEVRAFPSIHFRRKVSESSSLDVSYAARINRPGFEQLDPVVRLFGEYASSGNPNLDPTTVDAFEAALGFRKDPHTLLLTAFNRISRDVVGTRRDLVGAVFVSQPINFGESVERGIELQARGPLAPRWSYTVNGNLLERAFDGLRGGATVQRSVTQYGGSARLEYRDADQEAVGADQVQLNFTLSGPTYDLQSEARGYGVIDLTWRRRLTKDVVSVLSVTDVFASRVRTTEVYADDYSERTTRDSPGARVRLVLTYQFGDPAKRQPDQSAPPTPGG